MKPSSRSHFYWKCIHLIKMFIFILWSSIKMKPSSWIIYLSISTAKKIFKKWCMSLCSYSFCFFFFVCVCVRARAQGCAWLCVCAHRRQLTTERFCRTVTRFSLAKFTLDRWIERLSLCQSNKLVTYCTPNLSFLLFSSVLTEPLSVPHHELAKCCHQRLSTTRPLLAVNLWW